MSTTANTAYTTTPTTVGSKYYTQGWSQYLDRWAGVGTAQSNTTGSITVIIVPDDVVVVVVSNTRSSSEVLISTLSVQLLITL